jgi:2-keto-4-pentenoate hydratase/2-oxohepta-3-ene-1,7-dioic acid hydratase in catechol pathway
VKLKAPIEPSLILCSGENYWDHRDEKPQVTRKDPEFFLKTSLGVIGPDDDIVRDERVTQKLDYETELLIVIGEGGRHIAAADAHRHIFGYSIMNDVTARDRQVTLRPDGSSVYNLGPGKNFDTCAPIGPHLVTRDEIPDPQKLELATLVNGEARQSNSTAKMIWTCAQLVEFFSTFVTLRPGVVISTGTPGGTAWGTDPELGGKKPMRKDVVAPKGYLQPGDEVICRIEGLGELRNRVVAV